MKIATTTLATLTAAILMSACTTHIAPYRPKHRTFDPGDYPASTTARRGSIYAGGGGLIEDDVAQQVGDIVVIRIDERDAASRAGTTKLDKTDTANYGVPAAVGLLAALQRKYPNVDPAQLFATASDMSFSGAGTTERKGALTATLPVRVRRQLGNGDLFVEGTKVVMIGNEEQHIYVSGIVRRRDIAEDNTVPSSRVADAEIEYTGRGDVSDQQRRGWGSRLLARAWPF